MSPPEDTYKDLQGTKKASVYQGKSIENHGFSWIFMAFHEFSRGLFNLQDTGDELGRDELLTLEEALQAGR